MHVVILVIFFLKKVGLPGAQVEKCPTLDLGSNHDLTVRGSSPESSSVLKAQSQLGILSPICPPTPMCECSLARALSLFFSLEK